MSVFVIMEAELCTVGKEGSHSGRTPVPVSLLVTPNLQGVEAHFGLFDVHFRAIVPGPAWAKSGISISSSSWSLTAAQYHKALELWEP